MRRLTVSLQGYIPSVSLPFSGFMVSIVNFQLQAQAPPFFSCTEAVCLTEVTLVPNIRLTSGWRRGLFQRRLDVAIVVFRLLKKS